MALRGQGSSSSHGWGRSTKARPQRLGQDAALLGSPLGAPGGPWKPSQGPPPRPRRAASRRQAFSLEPLSPT
ncbi:Hypothetical predicted protein [Podarcis lilfordi]|uniref:Uncharacterized protein n=1 Tax=Podarcis lilfordi TaxID=74358 RepID=A0AA35KI68_9SAUR|nr:Hypothetical predicted protein [Podarcis lilfordi]